MMHSHDLRKWQHDHVYHVGDSSRERSTWKVVGLTAAMMVIEIVTGWLSNSMALLADGWHMSTHAAALSVTGIAYALARRYTSDTRFAFGTWKIEALGGYTSAILLALVALYMAVESSLRLFRPLEIHYDQALGVAVVGLLVNLASAMMLYRRTPDLATGHGHHHDPNLLAAYTHVLADALTSVLAIGALIGGRVMQWYWLDPMMGIVGAGVITFWAYGLLRDSGGILLDRETDGTLARKVRELLESDGDTRVTDLHFVRVGPVQFACICSIVADHPRSPEEYKSILRECTGLNHLTIEVSRCPGH